MIDVPPERQREIENGRIRQLLEHRKNSLGNCFFERSILGGWLCTQFVVASVQITSMRCAPVRCLEETPALDVPDSQFVQRFGIFLPALLEQMSRRSPFGVQMPSECRMMIFI